MRATIDQSARSHHDPTGPYEAYHKIHKHLVGPATADRLVTIYESLSQVQRPREMFVAGWAAAEAALVGTTKDIHNRITLAQSAKDCWEFALQLETERSCESAWLRDTTPDTTEQYRYASTLALAPIIEAIPRGIVPKQTLRDCQRDLLRVAKLNNQDMQQAMQAGVEGRAASHLGLAFEQIGTLGVNRLMSGRIISLFSLARSGTGFYYPKQTHDMMVLNLSKNNISRVAPTEVKSQLRVKFSHRYEAALIGGKMILGEDRKMVGQTLDLLEDELAGTVPPEGKRFLEGISDSIIHSIRHHHRAQQFGRHCLNANQCTLPSESHIV